MKHAALIAQSNNFMTEIASRTEKGAEKQAYASCYGQDPNPKALKPVYNIRSCGFNSFIVAAREKDLGFPRELYVSEDAVSEIRTGSGSSNKMFMDKQNLYQYLKHILHLRRPEIRASEMERKACYRWNSSG
jgi:hypothetical protein